MIRKQIAWWLKLAGMLLLGLIAAFWLYLAVGAITGGDLSGAGQLLPVALAVVLMILAWNQPRIGGVALVVAGLLFSVVYYFLAKQVDNGWVPVLITGVPFILAGLLFLVVSWLGGEKPPGAPMPPSS